MTDIQATIARPMTIARAPARARRQREPFTISRLALTLPRRSFWLFV